MLLPLLVLVECFQHQYHFDIFGVSSLPRHVIDACYVENMLFVLMIFSDSEFHLIPVCHIHQIHSHLVLTPEVLLVVKCQIST